MRAKTKQFLKRFLPLPASNLEARLADLERAITYQIQNLANQLRLSEGQNDGLQSASQTGVQNSRELLLRLIYEQRQMIRSLIPDAAPFIPKVSVIVPVYNAAPYLRQCLDSINAQTLWDFELICVDDGSTDESTGILELYSRFDPRIRVIRQDNAGAGAARNAGMKAATGEYLIFLDADDFFEPLLLQHMYEACVLGDADIGLCAADHFDEAAGQYQSEQGLLNVDLLPDKKPFSRRDCPDDLFQIASSSPWTKMFRRSFIEKAGLEYQTLRRANDLYFVYSALALAERIVVCDEMLVHYRVSVPGSLQATNSESPLEFYEALTALQQKLRDEEIYTELKQSFARMALGIVEYNIKAQTSPEAAEAVDKAYREQYKRQFEG